jgi:hypothetical protein
MLSTFGLAAVGILIVVAFIALPRLLPLLNPEPTATPLPTARPTELGADQITTHTFPSIGYGVHAFLWWNETTRTRDLEFVRLMRFDYVKQIFGWGDVFPARDEPPTWTYADEVVAEADYRGVKLIARLGSPPSWAERPDAPAGEPPYDVDAFARYCGALAERYAGRIIAYQVWNEPNLDREWLGRTPSAAEYVRLLAACHAAIKAADPAAVVISAGLAPTGTYSSQVIPDDVYLIQLYDAGLGDYYDVLGLNAPGYRSPPDTPPDDPALDGNRWQAFRHVEDMRAIMVQRGQGSKQVAILEMGWTTDPRDTITTPDGETVQNLYRWHAVSEDQQAEYLVGAYEYAAQHWRPWISLMIAIYLPDPAWTQDNEEYWWALIEPGNNLRMRPAFIALANAPRHIDGRDVPSILDGVNPYTPMPPRPR